MPDSNKNQESSGSAHLERAEIKKTTEAVEDSARDIERSASKIEVTSDRSTQLAADRTVFAAERTYAAWVRTGLASLASGIGAKAVLAKALPDVMVQFASTILIIFSAFCFCAAVWRELVPSMRDPISEVRRIPRPILFFINGSLVMIALFALVSIWVSWLEQPS